MKKFIAIESCPDTPLCPNMSQRALIISAANEAKARAIALAESLGGPSHYPFSAENADYEWRRHRKDKDAHTITLYEVAAESDAGLLAYLDECVAKQKVIEVEKKEATERAEFERLNKIYGSKK